MKKQFKVALLFLYILIMTVNVSCKSKLYNQRIKHLQKLYAPPFTTIKANEYITSYYLVTGKYPTKKEVVNYMSKYDSLLFNPKNFYYKVDSASGKLIFYSYFPSGKDGNLVHQVKTPLLLSREYEKSMYTYWDFLFKRRVNMDLWPSKKAPNPCDIYALKFLYKNFNDSAIYPLKNDIYNKIAEIIQSLHLINKKKMVLPSRNKSSYAIYRYEASKNHIIPLCEGNYIANEENLQKMADSLHKYFPDIEYMVFDLENVTVKTSKF